MRWVHVTGSGVVLVSYLVPLLCRGRNAVAGGDDAGAGERAQTTSRAGEAHRQSEAHTHRRGLRGADGQRSRGGPAWLRRAEQLRALRQQGACASSRNTKTAATSARGRTTPSTTFIDGFGRHMHDALLSTTFTGMRMEGAEVLSQGGAVHLERGMRLTMPCSGRPQAGAAEGKRQAPGSGAVEAVSTPAPRRHGLRLHRTCAATAFDRSSRIVYASGTTHSVVIVLTINPPATHVASAR